MDADELAEKHGITPKEVEALIEAFKAGNKKGTPIKKKKFAKIIAQVHKTHPADNLAPPLADVLFNLFDSDSNGEVDVLEFIAGVSTLSSGSVEEKAKLLFNALDYDNSGSISRQEFSDYLDKSIKVAKEAFLNQSKSEGLNVGVRLSLKVGMKKVETTIAEDVLEAAFKADTNNDGEIDLEEFLTAVREGNKAIIQFLNPGDHVVHTVGVMGEELQDEGYVTNKKDYEAMKKRAFS